MLNSYRNILVAIDLNPKGQVLLMERAKQLKASMNCEIYLIHVIEHINNYTDAYGITFSPDLDETLFKSAQDYKIS